jgi:hypothetical protein
MPTKSPVPNFKYSSKDPANRHFGFIEIGEAEKFWIDSLENFYQAFGYSNDMRKLGILPNQFIWEEYLSDTAKNSLCFQLHTIEYLIKYSAPFLKMYGEQCDDWIAALTEARSAEDGEECRDCIESRNKKYCSK